MNFSNTLLVSDIDGTLIGADQQIPQANRDAIAQYCAAGGRFAIASGRTRGTAHLVLDQITPTAPSIFINGVVDLNHEALDLKAIVVPSLNTEGASLALAVANPLVGLSTFVAQLALKDQINSFFAQEYHVSGGFDEPVIDKVSNRQHP